MVSRLWTAGTPIAAAITPVIVTIVKEMLDRPTAKIAEKVTVETDALPEATGSGAPPPAAEQEDDAEPAREQPLRDMPRDVKLYRAAGATGRRIIPWKLIAATAALAFVIASRRSPPQLCQAIPATGNGAMLRHGHQEEGQDRAHRRECRQSPGQDPQQPPSTSPESTLTTGRRARARPPRDTGSRADDPRDDPGHHHRAAPHLHPALSRVQRGGVAPSGTCPSRPT